MKALSWMAAIALIAGAVSQSGDAHALFLKKTLKKAKNVADDAGKKLKDGAKKAADTVKSGVTNAANKVASGAKKLFESAKAGVVNLANKAKRKASELAQYVQQKGMYLFAQILPGEFRRLHKNLLRSAGRDATPGGSSGKVGSGAGGSSATFSVGPAGETANPAVPEAMKKFASWYDYRAGDVQPAKSKSLKSRQSLVKDQSSRGTCVAFATIAAMEAQISRPKLLSQEYMYWLYKDGDKSKICNEAEDGVVMSDAAKVLASGKGVPEEVHYLYLPWRGFDFAKLCPAGPSGLAKKLADYKPKQTYFFPWRSTGQGATIANPRFIEAAIDAGFEIISSFDVTFMQKNMGILGGYFFDATVDPGTGKATKAPGGHAMVIVGYDRSGDEKHGGGHIIVKNSWGALWGDGGYVKLSYDYVRQYAGEGIILEGVGK